ncbi:MAG: histidine--tRNA ligase [Sphingobacteriaceae bacterium]|nr:histidine--tRNA ligase [Sphingobacteriaceae bacterium]
MKPSIPRGTRDFGPSEMKKRNYILNVIRNNFELFGYAPIETPAMENISTLTGKYGDEGDQLIFKILNSRIHESKNKEALLNEFTLSLKSSRNSETLTEKALRYDLTVPFARFVVMNQHQLHFPFKRYQIQPVWRADRPQKGRYREFYQCDADVIGSDSLINELDLVAMMDKSFSTLKIPVKLKINNRKILTAISQLIDAPDKIIPITVAIDKLDKIGKDGVIEELKNIPLPAKAINILNPLLDNQGSNAEKIGVLKNLLSEVEVGKKGIEELEFLLNNLKTEHVTLELDITLARGLTYYTGTIFEAKVNEGDFTPSILGGGRYDDLTGIFGLKGMSGVGISFGVDRIYDVMEELNLFPDQVKIVSVSKLLFAHFDEESRSHALELAHQLRNNQINCEVYPELTKKIGKQIDYANKLNIPFVCTIGSNEIQSKAYSFKNMADGQQQQFNLQQIIDFLK